MKRLAFLGVGSAIILGFGVMGAAPAFADNGPHVSTSGSMTVDRCAGCHRAHTATNAYLLNQDETLLCESCHGTAGTGASSDVIDGVGYGMTAATGGARTATVLGALRGGGFENARIDSGNAVWQTPASTTYKIVPAASSGSTSTSQHAIGSAGTMWGNGSVDGTNKTAGPSVTLECTSCHDPHGNGNYRILRPVASATDANGVEKAAAYPFPAAVSVNSVTFKELARPEGRYKFYYTVDVASAGTFKETQPVTFYGTTGGADLIVSGTIESISGTTFVISGANSTAITGYTYNGTTKAYDVTGTPVAATGGKMYYANPAGLLASSFTATTATFTTAAVNGLVAGAKVTLAGFAPTGYNAAFIVTAVGSFSNNGSTFQNSFTVATTLNTAVTTLGSISGIPDAKASTDSHAVGGAATAKVYVTPNYWAADDHCYSGAANCIDTAQLASTKSAYIANVSQWCATCHTRLLAGSGAWGKNSGDKMFTFEHRSNNGAEGSPNCIQCHVAHGSNASMEGDVNSSFSKDVGTEFGLATTNSFLLRVDNRGTCNMCHNK